MILNTLLDEYFDKKYLKILSKLINVILPEEKVSW